MELFFLCLLRRRSVLNAFLNLLLLFLQNDPKRTKLKPYKEGRKEGVFRVFVVEEILGHQRSKGLKFIGFIQRAHNTPNTFPSAFFR